MKCLLDAGKVREKKTGRTVREGRGVFRESESKRKIERERVKGKLRERDKERKRNKSSFPSEIPLKMLQTETSNSLTVEQKIDRSENASNV